MQDKESVFGKIKNLPFLFIALLILVITIFHYTASLQHKLPLHELFRRLYYIPVILAAIYYRLKGGLMISVLISLIYIPHTIQQYYYQESTLMDNILEILMFNLTAFLIGYLMDVEYKRREELHRTMTSLERSLNIIKTQDREIATLEQELSAAERRSILGELTSALAHEVRNPLNSIRGVADILRNPNLGEEQLLEFVAILQKEVDHINDVVSQYLSYSRKSSDSGEISLLEEEIKNSVILMEKYAGQRHVFIRNECTGHLTQVQMAGVHVRQTFINLIRNSIDAMEQGGKIIIRYGGEDRDSISVIFSDTGKGIKPEFQQRIFEPFFSDKKEGAGLGLSIIKKILERNGHEIDVKSEPGKGTTFQLRFRKASGGEVQ